MAGVTVRFDMAPGAPLPEFAAACTELLVVGTAVPVRAVELANGAGALRGLIDPALVGAVL